MQDRDDLARILRGVQQLPDDRREALIMRFALGMDNREIARALDRTDGATKVLMHRAIRQLEDIVQADANGTGPGRDMSAHVRGHRGAPARRARADRAADPPAAAPGGDARLASSSSPPTSSRRGSCEAIKDPRNWPRAAIGPAAAVVVGSGAAVGLVVLRTQRKRHKRRAQSTARATSRPARCATPAREAREGLRRIVARSLIQVGRLGANDVEWTFAHSPTKT